MHRTQFAKGGMVGQDIWTVVELFYSRKTSKCGAMSESHRDNLQFSLGWKLTRISNKYSSNDSDYQQISRLFFKVYQALQDTFMKTPFNIDLFSSLCQKN